MAKNNNLHAAKAAKNDEFYTRIEDIEVELKNYKDYFKDKTVYCNCDDARESNFFKYFSMNFEFLGLKKLITTGFKADGKGVAYIYEGDKNKNYMVDDNEIQIIELEGNGDFRSEECINFLKEADIVVTNPPFSLFREYVAQLMEYEKKFIIIGSDNARTYKETFLLLKENKIWIGINHVKNFVQPDKTIKSFGNISWFTNIPHSKRNEQLELYQKYSSEYFPKYDNYDAIEVSKVSDIPIDYDGIMGVPITFLDRYCPEQFEILGIANSARWIGDFPCYTIIDGKKIYNRILIRKK